MEGQEEKAGALAPAKYESSGHPSPTKTSALNEQSSGMGFEKNNRHEATATAAYNGPDPTLSTESSFRDQTQKETSAPEKQIAVELGLADPGPPPDGGLVAWTQALVAHLVIFNTWGYINSFGVFQTYYVSTLEHSLSDISWVGSVQIFLLFFVGTFSGRATDTDYFRLTFIIGTLLQLIGVFLTSICTTYWQFFLAQGICTGLGSGLLFCPTLALLPTFFTKNRALAVGIAASGTTTGGMVLPGIVEGLLPRIGFGWTLRVIGFVMLALQLLALVLSRTRLPPRKSGPLVEWSAFTELPYVLFATGIFFVFWGTYAAYYYISEYASTVIGLSQTDSFNLIILINGIGVIGRLLPPYLADRYTGPTNIMIPFVVLSSVALYCWAAIFTEAGLFVFAAFYGLFSSSVNALFPTALANLTEDKTKMGTRMGMIFSIISFATLTGTPIAGALISGGGYLNMEMFAASLLMIGASTLVAARLAGTGMKLRIRV